MPSKTPSKLFVVYWCVVLPQCTWLFYLGINLNEFFKKKTYIIAPLYLISVSLSNSHCQIPTTVTAGGPCGRGCRACYIIQVTGILVTHLNKEKYHQTIKHSSRMRTARLPTIRVLVATTRCRYWWG